MRIVVVPLLLLILAAAFHAVSWGVRYEYWLNEYAKTHLKIAANASDPATALRELERARDLLSHYPKTGNTDPIMQGPETDLAMAWEAINGIIEYARSIPQLRDPFQIEHAMRELRSRVSGFLDRRFKAYESYVFYRGWVWNMLSIAFWIIGFIATYVALDNVWRDEEEMALGLLLLAYIAFAVVAVILAIIPVGYTGPR